MNIFKVFQYKCPRCGEGYLFRNKSIFPLGQLTQMHEECTVCGQKTELEVGFYYGTGYLSYALSMAFVIAYFVFYLVVFGISIKDNSVYSYLISCIVLLVLLQPWMMRFSRVLYLSFFVHPDKKK